MASESSFDVVSKVDRQEVDNAVNQAAKEISTRYDFRNVGASVELTGDSLTLRANSAERCLAVLDVLQTKLVKRGVSLKSVDFGEEPEPKASGKEYRLDGALKEGLSQEDAKRLSKQIRDEFGKSVKAVIQGDELRVSSKSRDDLQAVQRALRANDEVDAALQFVNYR
ncbi:YajQ family cyclic di-GMP-binding protein [Kytococcus sp. Marseille-QA3725]